MVLGKKSLILNLLSLFLLIIAGAISVSGQFTHTLSGVTINSPAQNQNISGNFTINITATKTFNLTNVTFHARMGNGTVVLIGTNSSSSLNGSIASGITFRFDTSLASFGNGGFGIFNISANLSELNGTTYNTTVENGSRNVSIANTPPTITLNAPSNNAFASSQKKFNFSVVSIVYPVIEACNLTIDGPAVNGTIAITNGSSPATSTIVSIATQSEGAHLWTFVCRDSSQQNASIANNTYTEDNTNPQANITIADTEGNDLTTDKEAGYGKELDINCVPGDTTAGLVTANHTIAVIFPGVTSYQNLTLLENSVTLMRASLSESETGILGVFGISCFTWDKAGNSNTTFLNVTVISVIAGKGSPFADPNFKAPIANKVVGKDTVEDYGSKFGNIPEQGVARLIKKLGAITFLIGDEEHTIKVEELTDDTVTLLISSEPFTLEMKTEETKEVDVNADGTNDLEIYFHKVHQKSADLVFKAISTPVVEEEPEVVQPPAETVTSSQTETKKSEYGWIMTLLALVLVAAIFMFVVHKFARRGGGQDDGTGNKVKFTPRDLGAHREEGSWNTPQETQNKEKGPFY